MSTTLKGKIEELKAYVARLEKVLEQHPHAYLTTIEHGREEWAAASASNGPAFEFTSDPRYPGRARSISIHRYEEIDGIRVYAPNGCGRNAEYMFEQLRKEDPKLYADMLAKVFG